MDYPDVFFNFFPTCCKMANKTCILEKQKQKQTNKKTTTTNKPQTKPTTKKL